MENFAALLDVNNQSGDVSQDIQEESQIGEASHIEKSDFLVEPLPSNQNFLEIAESVPLKKCANRKKKVSCKFCGKKFATKSALKKHTALKCKSKPDEVNHGSGKSGKPFACQICEVGFLYHRNLVRHQKQRICTKTHNFDAVITEGDEPQTSVPDKAAERQGFAIVKQDQSVNQLKKKIRTTEKGCYKCKRCLKVFSAKSKFNVHLARKCKKKSKVKIPVHSARKNEKEERPIKSSFVCFSCGLCFRLQKYLSQHQKRSNRCKALRKIKHEAETAADCHISGKMTGSLLANKKKGINNYKKKIKQKVKKCSLYPKIMEKFGKQVKKKVKSNQNSCKVRYNLKSKSKKNGGSVEKIIGAQVCDVLIKEEGVVGNQPFGIYESAAKVQSSEKKSGAKYKKNGHESTSFKKVMENRPKSGKCLQCGKVFVTVSNMNKHLRLNRCRNILSGENTWNCNTSLLKEDCVEQSTVNTPTTQPPHLLLNESGTIIDKSFVESIAALPNLSHDDDLPPDVKVSNLTFIDGGSHEKSDVKKIVFGDQMHDKHMSDPKMSKDPSFSVTKSFKRKRIKKSDPRIEVKESYPKAGEIKIKAEPLELSEVDPLENTTVSQFEASGDFIKKEPPFSNFSSAELHKKEKNKVNQMGNISESPLLDNAMKVKADLSYELAMIVKRKSMTCAYCGQSFSSVSNNKRHLRLLRCKMISFSSESLQCQFSRKKRLTKKMVDKDSLRKKRSLRKRRMQKKFFDDEDSDDSLYSTNRASNVPKRKRVDIDNPASVKNSNSQAFKVSGHSITNETQEGNRKFGLADDLYRTDLNTIKEFEQSNQRFKYDASSLRISRNARLMLHSDTPEMEEESMIGSYIYCNDCGKQFLKRKYLIQHRRLSRCRRVRFSIVEPLISLVRLVSQMKGSPEEDWKRISGLERPYSFENSAGDGEAGKVAFLNALELMQKNPSSCNTSQIESGKENEPQNLDGSQIGKENEPLNIDTLQIFKENEPQNLDTSQISKENESQNLDTSQIGQENETQNLDTSLVGQVNEPQNLDTSQIGQENEPQNLDTSQIGKEKEPQKLDTYELESWKENEPQNLDSSQGKENEPQNLDASQIGKENEPQNLDTSQIAQQNEPPYLDTSQIGKENEPQGLDTCELESCKENEPQSLDTAQFGKENDPQNLISFQIGKENQPQNLDTSRICKENEPHNLDTSQIGQQNQPQNLDTSQNGKENDPQSLDPSQLESCKENDPQSLDTSQIESGKENDSRKLEHSLTHDDLCESAKEITKVFPLHKPLFSKQRKSVYCNGCGRQFLRLKYLVQHIKLNRCKGLTPHQCQTLLVELRKNGKHLDDLSSYCDTKNTSLTVKSFAEEIKRENHDGSFESGEGSSQQLDMSFTPGKTVREKELTSPLPRIESLIKGNDTLGNCSHHSSSDILTNNKCHDSTLTADLKKYRSKIEKITRKSNSLYCHNCDRQFLKKKYLLQHKKMNRCKRNILKKSRLMSLRSQKVKDLDVLHHLPTDLKAENIELCLKKGVLNQAQEKSKDTLIEEPDSRSVSHIDAKQSDAEKQKSLDLSLYLNVKKKLMRQGPVFCIDCGIRFRKKRYLYAHKKLNRCKIKPLPIYQTESVQQEYPMQAEPSEESVLVDPCNNKLKRFVVKSLEGNINFEVPIKSEKEQNFEIISHLRNKEKSGKRASSNSCTENKQEIDSLNQASVIVPMISESENVDLKTSMLTQKTKCSGPEIDKISKKEVEDRDFDSNLIEDIRDKPLFIDEFPAISVASEAGPLSQSSLHDDQKVQNSPKNSLEKIIKKTRWKCPHCTKRFIYKSSFIKHLKLNACKRKTHKSLSVFKENKNTFPHKANDLGELGSCSIKKEPILHKECADNGSSSYEEVKIKTLSRPELQHAISNDTEKECDSVMLCQDHSKCICRILQEARGNIYTCCFCNMKFSKLVNLNRHFKLNRCKGMLPDSKPLCCFCEKSFSTLSNLDKHLKLKTCRLKGPCQCSCGKYFSNMGNLNKHMKLKRCKDMQLMQPILPEEKEEECFIKEEHDVLDEGHKECVEESVSEMPETTASCDGFGKGKKFLEDFFKMPSFMNRCSCGKYFSSKGNLGRHMKLKQCKNIQSNQPVFSKEKDVKIFVKEEHDVIDEGHEEYDVESVSEMPQSTKSFNVIGEENDAFEDFSKASSFMNLCPCGKYFSSKGNLTRHVKLNRCKNTQSEQPILSKEKDEKIFVKEEHDVIDEGHKEYDIHEESVSETPESTMLFDVISKEDIVFEDFPKTSSSVNLCSCGKYFSSKGNLTRHVKLNRCKNIQSNKPILSEEKDVKILVKEEHGTHDGHTEYDIQPVSEIPVSTTLFDGIGKEPDIFEDSSKTSSYMNLCSSCGKCFSSKGNLSRHVKLSQCKNIQSNQPRPILSEEKDAKFSVKEELDVLVEEHMEYDMESVSEIPESTTLFDGICEENIFEHSSKTSSFMNLCSTCGKCFSSKGNLTRHVKLNRCKDIQSEQPILSEEEDVKFLFKEDHDILDEGLQECDTKSVNEMPENKSPFVVFGKECNVFEDFSKTSNFMKQCSCGKYFSSKGNLNKHKKLNRCKNIQLKQPDLPEENDVQCFIKKEHDVLDLGHKECGKESLRKKPVRTSTASYNVIGKEDNVSEDFCIASNDTIDVTSSIHITMNPHPHNTSATPKVGSDIEQSQKQEIDQSSNLDRKTNSIILSIKQESSIDLKNLFKCQICDRRFLYNKNRLRHMKLKRCKHRQNLDHGSESFSRKDSSSSFKIKFLGKGKALKNK